MKLMKRCGRCQETKDVAAFHRSTRRGRQAWCKECRRSYDAEYHRRNRERLLAKKRALHASFRHWYMSLKEGTPCTDCGNSYPAPVMQWDHLPGTEKTADLGYLWRKHNKQRVLDEIAKCELVCANCHALRTLSRRGA